MSKPKEWANLLDCQTLFRVEADDFLVTLSKMLAVHSIHVSLTAFACDRTFILLAAASVGKGGYHQLSVAPAWHPNYYRLDP